MPQKLGFTIVELLIVIVVVAILAAITFVGYSSFQSRAHDAAIRSDFNNIAKLLEIYKIQEGSYPSDPASNPGETCAVGAGTVIYPKLASIEMKLSTGSYNTSTANTNLLYLASNDGQHYALLGYALGNPTYYITDTVRSAAVYNPGELAKTRYPGGTPCGIADHLGLSAPTINADFGFYYIFNVNGGGFRVWN